MSLPTPQYLYTSEGEVRDLISSAGVDLRLDDDQSVADPDIDNDDDNTTGIDDDELARLTTAVIAGTARVNTYAGKRYSRYQLSLSSQVHLWATDIAAYWLCRRRLNPVPESLKDAYKEALAELDEVRAGTLDITDIKEAQSAQPTLSNVTLDGRRSVRVIRVERPISTNKPSANQRTFDQRADIIAGAEEGYQ